MLFRQNSLRFFCVLLGLLFLPACELEEEMFESPRSDIQGVNETGESLYAPSPSSYADSLLQVTEVYIEAAKYDSALASVRTARRVYYDIDYKEGIVRSVNIEGDALEQAGEYDEALAILEKNLKRGKEWLGPDHLIVGDTYNKLGVAHVNKGNYSSAIDNYNKSLEIRLLHLEMTHSLVGKIKSNIGVIHAEIGDFDRALEYYKEALAITIKESGEGSVDAALGYSNIAVALKNKGDYKESLLYHDRALAIRREVLGASHPALGASYYNIGVTHGESGEYDKAVENHEEALGIWLNAFPNGHPFIATTFGALSIDHQELKNYEQALEYGKKSLIEIIDIFGEDHDRVGLIYKSLGQIYLSKGEYDIALDFFQKSIEIFKNRASVQIHQLAKVYMSIGLHYYDQGNMADALHFVNLSLQTNHLNNEPFTLEKAIVADEYSSDASLLESLILRARIYASMSKGISIDTLTIALETYQTAVDVIKAYSLSFKNNGSKLLLAEQATEMYEDAIQVALSLYRLTQDASYLNHAFQFAELGKASVLLNAMNEAEALKQAGIPDSLLEQEKELRLLLTYHDKNLKSELVKGDQANQKTIQEQKERLFSLKKTYNELLETFELTYPAYFDLKYRNYTASIDDVTQILLSPDEIFLEYVVGTDSLYIFVLADAVQHVEVVSIDSTFQNKVGHFKKGLAQRDREYYIPAAYELYSKLVEPISDIISQTHNWVIVADDFLNGIPFGALISKSKKVDSNYYDLPYLIENHSFRYTYSATLELSQTILKKRQDTLKGSIEKKDFMAFAPVFKEGFIDWQRGADMLEDFRPDTVAVNEWGYLPQSKSEVKSIQSMFKENYPLWDRLFADRSKIYLNDNASEQTLKSIDLSQHRFIHFATHGVVNKSVPELSGIILAQNTAGGEDGILHLSEVYNLDLDADLVVLSACQTGTGKMAKGEGLMSLTRGFMYAGADALLASYWQVADGSTNWLMVSFYEYLLSGLSKSEALQNAKMDLIDSYPQFAQPYYWASFVLIGK